MCGRFSLATNPDTLARQFELPQVPELDPRYNIAPSQDVAVVRASGGPAPRELVHMRWGLVPHWAKDPAIGHRMINARVETAASRSAFRDALERRRCIVPADGFYEWKKAGGVNQPYWLHAASGDLLGMAGIWERWRTPEDDWLLSVAILTTEPNDYVALLHDRMPVVLPRESYAPWLDTRRHAADSLAPLMPPVANDALEAVPVSLRLNKPEHEDPGVREPAGPALMHL